MLSLRVLTQLLADPQLRQLASRVLAGQVKAGLKSLQVSAALSRRLILESRQPAEPGSGTAEDRLLRNVLAEHLEYYAQVLDQNILFSEHVSRILQATEATAQTVPRETPTMQLSAPVGTTLQEAFRIRSNRAAPITASFRISSFVSDDGGHAVFAKAVFDPPAVELGPGQERKVVFLLPLGGDFEAGKTYRATISAAGMDSLRILIVLRVEPAQQVVETPAEPVAPAAKRVRAAKAAKPKRAAAPRKVKARKA
ncbi:MAG: hypothetical protein ACJ76J_13325 [Thermoanaerobaculia bacterium]